MNFSKTGSGLSLARRINQPKIISPAPRCPFAIFIYKSAGHMNFDPISQLSTNVRTRFFIDGEWVGASSTRRHTLISPFSEAAVLDVPLADHRDVERAIAAARRAFDQGPWPHMAGRERALYIGRLTEALRLRLPLLAELWTAQVGMPISFARSLIHQGIMRFQYFGAQAASYIFEDRRQTARGHARVRREPVGVAALIAPWNATFPIVASKIAAALAAGCTMVVKSPAESPLEALIVAECAAEAGFPPGVINVITADREESAQLVGSADIDKISFTGSVDTGRAIAKVAAERMARVTLELGGKSAAILLDDIDLPSALSALAPFTMPFSGQICFSQTRIIAPRSRVDEVVDTYASMMSGLTVGDPREPATQVGPVLNARQYARVLGFIGQGVDEGATKVIGGGRTAGFDKGHFIDPTVFTDVTVDMRIAREEIFGPVVAILAYEDLDDAVRIANHSSFGLSGSVFGRDAERAYDVACRIRTGHIGVNGLELAANVPFGGYKMSGIGREGGTEGLEAFLETKAILMPA
jgi:acyl-CoA reductase-like NAD-dependent aldehyde dehydrogenase